MSAVTTFKAPYGRGTVTVAKGSVDRYKAAGWVEVKDEAPAEPRKRSAAKRSDKK